MTCCPQKLSYIFFQEFVISVHLILSSKCVNRQILHTVKHFWRVISNVCLVSLKVKPLHNLFSQDLYSVMIRGPERTPYEDGLFFFDFQLSADYPRAPPLCHYVTYCSDKLNPNLYEDGKASMRDEGVYTAPERHVISILFQTGILTPTGKWRVLWV